MRQVSPEQKNRIIAAAESLVTSGIESPTNEQIREHLGGGSIADISPVMREWRQEQRKQVRAVLTLPENVRAAADRFVSQLWESADSEASKAISAIKGECDLRVNEVTQERDEALTEIQRLESELQKLATEFEAAKKSGEEKEQQISELNDAVTELKTERKASTVQIEAANKRADDLAVALKECQAQQQALQKELIDIAKAKK